MAERKREGMITTILFDLDGTLLPMDQEEFVKDYSKRLAKKMYPHGYDPGKLIDAIWKGMGYMIKNDGKATNEEVFWNIFSRELGPQVREKEDVFLDFYEHEFQEVAKSCGYNEAAKKTIDILKEKGYRLILATNPVFPPVATHSRIRWAGLEPSDFEYITTYDNSRHCKPNPCYYEDILKMIGCKPQECLMVGNDVTEDMVAEKLGMKVFLLTDCLINREEIDISRCPQGSFGELVEFIELL